MKQIYGTTIHEIDYVRANEILMSITPVQNQSDSSSKLNQSQSSPSNEPGSPSGKISPCTLRSSTIVSVNVKKTGTDDQPPEVDCSGNQT